MAEGTEAAAMTAPGPPQMPAVFVKNTFLDLDDGLRMPELQRWRSAPNPDPVRDDSDEEEASEAAPEEAEADAEPPPLPDLYRTKTCDGYEPAMEWTWLGGDPNNLGGGDLNFGGGDLGIGAGPLLGGGDFPPCVALGEMPGAPAGPLPPQAQPMAPGAVGGVPQPVFGMVMVPAEAMQGAPMFTPVMGPPPPFVMPGMPADCVAVPVARFTRWPENLPQGGPVPSMPDDGQLPLSELAAAAAAAAADAEDAGGELGQSPPMPAPPRAPVLQRTFSVPSSLDRIRWTVDARKLKSTDREAVSPMFELSFSKIVNFKILIRPKVISSVRGGASFKKAKGKGSVELRCLDEVTAAMNPVVTFRISVGSGTDPARQEPPRGPVRHDFTKKAICGLPAGEEEWDFSKAVDEATQTFVVCLEVLAGNS